MAHREDLSTPAYRILGARPTIAALSAIDTTVLKDGALVYVSETQAVYALRKNSEQQADGVIIVRPDQSDGRWAVPRQLQLFAETRDWYIHADGDDQGPGTEGDPLRTGAELSRRLATLIEPANTTVHYLTDMQPDDYLVGPNVMAPGTSFLIEAPNLTMTAEITVTAFQAGSGAGSCTRARVTVAGSPNWAASLVGDFFVLQGNPNVTGYIIKVDPSDNTSAFITVPFNELTVNAAVLVPGDVLRIFRPRLIGQGLNMNPRMVGLGAAGGAVTSMRGIKVADAEPDSFVAGVTLANSISAYNCTFNVFSLLCQYYANIVSCDLGYSTGFGYWDCVGMIAVYGGFNKGRVVWGGPGSVELLSFTTVETKTEVRYNLEYDISQTSSYWDFPTGPAIEIEPGCFFNHRARAYGVSAEPNTYGIAFNTGSMGHYASGTNNLPNIRGTLGTGGAGTKDMEIGGSDVLYAGLPHINATNLTRFVLRFAV